MFDATLYHLEHLNYLVIALALLFGRKLGDKSKRIEISPTFVVASLLVLVAIHTQAIDYRIGLNWYFPTR